jgi:SRF-type transcription factor (DNA-binding and dimerisation domain)
MATEISNHDPAVSPSHDHDDNNGLGVDTTRPAKRQRANPDDDDDDDEKGGKERRKIDIKFIQDKSRRHITFSKRKAGIMKKVSRANFVPGLSRVMHAPLTCTFCVLFHPIDMLFRPTNFLYLLVLKFFFLSCLRLVLCIHSQLQNYSHLSRRAKERT